MPENTGNLNSLNDFLDRIAEKFGNKDAVIFGEQKLTYNELAIRANELAYQLCESGVSPRNRIGIGLPRSLDYIVTLFAVLKLGATYVPLDVNYPVKRLKHLQRSSRLANILTTRDYVGLFPGPTILLEELRRSSPALPKLENFGDEIAYLIHTSGSTGQPKGVMIRHKSVVNYVGSLGKAIGLRPDDVYLHAASFSFSASVRQLMMPLSAGATVCLAADDLRSNPLALLRLIKQKKVTVFDTFPSYLRRLVMEFRKSSNGAGAELKDNQLRLTLTTSEPLSYRLVSDLNQHFRDVRFNNMYGQTETCGINTIYKVPRDFDTADAAVPVGKTFGHGDIHLLNSSLKPVSNGEEGEIYISGDCVSAGYFDDPVLNDRCFFQDNSKATYRTGDCAKLLEDGNLLLLGRRDRIVKIRGHRVALNEIEQVLEEHPDVEEAKAKVFNRTSDDRLTAYVIPSKSFTTARVLRNYLSQKLPAYMVPNVIPLESFPSLPNGKVDYNSLPPMASLENLPRNGPQQNGLERELLKLWKDALKVETIAVDDDFFELGGDSLMAASLFYEIEHLTGTRLPLATILERPTVRGVAFAIEREKFLGTQSCIVKIKPSGSKAPFFCVHGLGGNVITYRSLAPYLSVERPLYGIQARGVDGLQAPLRSVEEMAACYIEEIKRIQPVGPYYLGGYSFGGWIAVEIGHQLTTLGERLGFLALFDSHKTFDSREAMRDQNVLVLTSKRLVYQIRQFLGSAHKIRYVQARARTALRRVRTRLDMVKLYETRRAAELPDSIAALHSANWIALRNYVPNKVYGRVSLFVTSERSPFFRTANEEWGDLADYLDVHQIPGTHNTIFSEPHVRVLASKLNALMD